MRQRSVVFALVVAAVAVGAGVAPASAASDVVFTLTEVSCGSPTGTVEALTDGNYASYRGCAGAGTHDWTWRLTLPAGGGYVGDIAFLVWEWDYYPSIGFRIDMQLATGEFDTLDGAGLLYRDWTVMHIGREVLSLDVVISSWGIQVREIEAWMSYDSFGRPRILDWTSVTDRVDELLSSSLMSGSIYAFLAILLAIPMLRMITGFARSMGNTSVDGGGARRPRRGYRVDDGPGDFD